MAQKEPYDFIIIGGGTSGLVLASRLSENPNIQVLVLEAGEDQTENPLVQTPAFYSANLGSAVDWNFTTEPQTGLAGRKILLNQGKALGGSSAINAQVFVPPSAVVIDAWGELGNKGWSWETLAPYYEKVFTEPTISPEDKEKLGISWEKRNSAGPVQTSYPNVTFDPLPTAWIETFKNIGHQMPSNPFSRSGTTSGAFISLASVDPTSVTRSYSATTYYAIAKERTNLTVFTGCSVKKILLEGAESSLRATGVQYLSNAGSIFVSATQEVILAAGALQSPKILELSGIGNPNLLNALGIPVVIDNPAVGENLQDHILSGIGFEANEGIETKDGLVRNEQAALGAALEAYGTTKMGPLASVELSPYAYLPVMEFLSEGGQAKLEGLLKIYTPDEKESLITKENYKIASRILDNPSEASAIFLVAKAQVVGLPTVPPMEGPQPGNYITPLAVLAHPLSRGNVHITSNDSTAAPSIDPKYMNHPLDLDVFARHLLYVLTIAKLEPFKSRILKKNGRLRDPASNLKSLDEAKEYVKTSSVSMWHPTSTCSMLPKEKGGVVDSELLVYGTSNLRVVDASIFPLIPRGNPQATVYAVAEKAADIIKRCHNLYGCV